MSEFTQVQQAFIDYIRAPEAGTPPKGTDARHMAVYRELFFNNVSGFVNNAFPVLKSLHAPARWQQRLRHFFAEHDCHSPLFVDIARAFLEYLEGLEEADWPFEAELAQYEYLELWVDTQEAVTDQPTLSAIADDTPLCLYRASALGTYDYPVQCISPSHPEPEPEPTFLLLYRDEAEEVQFSQLNPLTTQLLMLVSEQPGVTPDQLRQSMAAMLPQMDPAALAAGLSQILEQMAQRGILRLAKK
ncbi:DUF2063 domain-containing protein [Ferrimonas balearica]|uniref:HvfC family RiPP maturation protein n=1 Tax=Ferrimonas balearica TaxID=44012 RepID=UPI001C992421|nr:putative DNA-binding domain-containing protein [Ferrimonas balearica]MBY5990858.1 putative DNA-binding domain-containing protein [Ferrimonas balearica]